MFDTDSQLSRIHCVLDEGESELCSNVFKYFVTRLGVTGQPLLGGFLFVRIYISAIQHELSPIK
jgi:hypothetical protein